MTKIPFEQYEGVIFDLDGTLIDSMWVWGDVDEAYLDMLGYSEIPEDFRPAIEGMTFDEVAVYCKERFNIPGSIEEIMAVWNDMAFEKYRTAVMLKPGAKELLEKLRSLSIPIGIATSNSPELTQAVLQNNGIDGFFTVIRTSEDVSRGKPEPDVYLHAAAGLKADPSKCLVFEDVLKGIQAGKNAGMTVCAVYDDLTKYDTEEKKRLADYYIESFFDVI